MPLLDEVCAGFGHHANGALDVAVEDCGEDGGVNDKQVLRAVNVELGVVDALADVLASALAKAAGPRSPRCSS